MNRSIFIKQTRKLLFVAASLLLIYSCGSGEPECSYFSRECAVDEGPIIPPTCDSNEAGIVDGCGVALSTLDIHDPVIINLQGLTPNSSHAITILNPDDTDISTLSGYAAGSSAATSDSDGNIYMSTIVQNMPNDAALGTYTVNVTDASSSVVQTWSYTTENQSRVRCMDGVDPSTATPKASFSNAENVYALAEGNLTDGSYNLYVISDDQTAIPDGGLISGTATTITIAGGSGGADLGTFTSGAYDILLDVNGNGYYDRETDLISRHARLLPCFVIQTANSATTLVEAIAADRYGNQREIFDPDANKTPIRDVYANITPSVTSAVTTPATADILIVAHQNTWAANDPLVDISGSTPPESNNGPVQNDSNAQGNQMQWSFTNLTAGCYDIVIDTDKNGVFTVGTDYVDNTNHLGDNTDCGLRVSTSNSSNITITSHSDDEITLATAINLAGNITNPTGTTLTAAYLRITSGTETNIVSMNSVVASNGGDYNVPIPLFSGDNYITVSGIFSNNTSMSETIMIRSLTDLALFRAQLTWDGSTDMDLHLVRPSGTYNNGDDDCNYRNCKVGLDGTGTNSINWGLPEESDDPKLDVDCISCGNGIENIWMSEINDNGVYKVYVDAFSGNENDSNVTVTVSILGSTVGQVNCGHMQSGSATDSCYVGDITWAGGTSGSGSFRPVGTLASTF